MPKIGLQTLRRVPKQNSERPLPNQVEGLWKRDVDTWHFMDSDVSGRYWDWDLSYVHTVPDKFSTGGKFVCLGVSFTWNYAKRTKIWTPKRSKLWRPKSRMNFWAMQSIIWAPQCKHLKRQNFCTAKAWLHGCVVTRLKNMFTILYGLRSVLRIRIE